ncbi:hypothetical protein J6595_16425 [Jiella sp. KSK16Y-1]|uniref:Uncharacterized protein n=2 Tax=Jiella mangrovi TaxID=2821407 RepID=A0ABS4BK86_9HYPH|nr:hypothetical protein [Jiella mangrovi]
MAGIIAVAALVAVPIADRSTTSRFASSGAGIDMMATGSIGAPDREYTIRRSVLQAPGSPPCILFGNGTSRGGC